MTAEEKHAREQRWIRVVGGFGGAPLGLVLDAMALADAEVAAAVVSVQAPDRRAVELVLAAHSTGSAHIVDENSCDDDWDATYNLEIRCRCGARIKTAEGATPTVWALHQAHVAAAIVAVLVSPLDEADTRPGDVPTFHPDDFEDYLATDEAPELTAPADTPESER